MKQNKCCLAVFVLVCGHRGFFGFRNVLHTTAMPAGSQASLVGSRELIQVLPQEVVLDVYSLL